MSRRTTKQRKSQMKRTEHYAREKRRLESYKTAVPLRREDTLNAKVVFKGGTAMTVNLQGLVRDEMFRRRPETRRRG